MSKGDHALDPRGLIGEAYRMEIGPPECRAILFDWALGLEAGAGPEQIRALLDHYGPRHPDHPMTAVLRAGLAAPPTARRRGGWRGKRRPD